MTVMEDPKVTILNLLKENWSLEFTPRFTTDWYDWKARSPTVVVQHQVTPVSFAGLGGLKRRHDAEYAIHVFSLSEDERWKMKEEVDRIIQVKRSNPGTDLEFVSVRNWVDLDEVDVSPKIYHSRILTGLVYFKTSAT